METDILRNTLMTHLDTLRRNLAVVSMEELRTRYRKPYYALVRDISTSASAYVRRTAFPACASVRNTCRRSCPP